ncbi:glycosyltransferase family 2 protein [Haloarcula sp. S1AR25-5A]|uniref:Glycosyltransferase family 2 protein n=1 Tax=Haloarcula terrestris TaxID=2950533 RepID=A0AAE4EVT3_9EURY|nr:glycosyltransferase family 2 protein [Haloarcula terrestris]MDS0220947.1 glycosyltransferase family 2 protein [Haloarcula terrestris]
MKILITMAGQGSRFRDAGVNKPKHEISVRGEPMFDWAMRSLESFYQENFIFVTQAEHNDTSFLDDATDRLGITQYQECVIDEYTNGQAQTALSANELIDPEEGVVIYNIDTYVQEAQLTPGVINGDGFIPVFTAPGERWSFVQTDDTGKVMQVSEKEKISDLATVGFYYFDRWEYFVNAYEHKAQQVEREYGETYVAPLYNHLIEKGHIVQPYKMDRKAVHVLGTPDDLRQFDPQSDI